MRFLTEQTAPVQIIDALQGAFDTKIAVAFWGDGAAEFLRIDRPGLTAKIICNLESGACNPSEIRRLIAMAPNVRVRSNPRLHAKLYWTRQCAVVGSSNASSNGLVVEGNALSGWAEANMLIDDLPTLIEMERWFDDLFNASHEISDMDLQQADAIWRTRRKLAAPGIILTRNLLDACRKTPNHEIWDHVKVAYWMDEMSEDAERSLAAMRDEQPALSEMSAYEDWTDYLKPGEWTIDFKVESTGREHFQGIWEILPSSPSVPNLSLAVPVQQLLLGAFGPMTLAGADLAAVGRLAGSFFKHHSSSNGRSAIPTLREVVARLDAPQSSGRNLRQFELAMRRIYTDSKAAGYTPSAYRMMLDRDGAIVTARKLVFAQNPSEGFTKLWELKRLDLTVEALILQEPWRHLFDSEMLKAARKRLDQFE